MTYRSARTRGKFAPWLETTKGRSGVYVIRSTLTKTVLYVGESHSGTLYKTITRHFWDWGDRTKRHHYTVGVLPVEVGIRLMPASQAQDEQDRLIVRLRPRHNRNVPTDEVPF